MLPKHLLEALSANVVLAIAGQPDPTAWPASMDTTEWTDSQANREIAVQPPDQLPNSFQNHPINARAKLHQETEALQDPKEATDHQAMQVHQALMVNPAIKDHADHPAHQARPEDQERKELQASLANFRAKKPVHPVHPVPTVNQAVQALVAKLAKLVKTVPPVPEALQAMQALQAVLARMAPRAVPANQAKPVHPVLAITAHRLVWLQVIKHWPRERSANNIDFYCDHKPIAEIMPSLNNISHVLFFILTQTFHVKKSSFGLSKF